MTTRIEICTKRPNDDVDARGVLADIAQLGITSVDTVRTGRIFLIEGDLDTADYERIAAELLADAVTERYTINTPCLDDASPKTHHIEVHLKPGVTDPVAASAQMAIEDMGLTVDSVRTARTYAIGGKLTDDQRDTIVRRVLANDCIEQVIHGHGQVPSPHTDPYSLELLTVAIRELDDAGLMDISKSRDLFLNLEEMKTIQGHYRKLDREPTDIELEMLAQTWSEHCVHKTFRGVIDFTEYDADGKEIRHETVENLLKTTIAKATGDLNKSWCISVFVDNAGIIELDEDYGICFKVETHNHPSAIEPYGGAATGIGGCIRDPMGTGLGAKPIANTDIFCFAAPDTPLDDLPEGALHPRRVMKGVVGGVRDYGNRMGIPTVNGAVLFDQRYVGNPLVFCGNIGLIPRDKCFGDAQDGNHIVVVGGRTGRDGIHGATFSSGEMTHEHETLFSHAVQIGNAITEKKALDTLMAARDEGLYVAITDCGAGGLSSSVGEMAETLGAVIDLETVPLKYDGLNYTEIWISEAQERMVISVPPEHLARAQEIFAAENVEATVIGRFGNDGTLELRYDGTVVGQLDMDFLHNGLPRYTRKAVWQAPALAEPTLPEKSDYSDDLCGLLSHYNIASKEWVIRQYDHEVQGGSVIKPLVGAANDGPGDAAVIRPRLDRDTAVAIGCGICPQYSDIDPYAMALAAIDEAVRNVVAVGCRADKIAILDNFCWGNCAKPDRLGSLVKACEGCYDAAMAFGTPFISGKDSLNNEFVTDAGETISIPGTLLISAMGMVDDAKDCVTMDLKTAGNLIVAVGVTKNELGGSHYYQLHGELGANVPKVDLKTAPAIMAAVAKAIAGGLVRSCHDCSEGGLAVAMAEMAFAGEIGAIIELNDVPVDDSITRTDQLLFSESTSRFLLEVAPEDRAALEKLFGDLPVAVIGTTQASHELTVTHKGKAVIKSSLGMLKNKWLSPLAW